MNDPARVPVIAAVGQAIERDEPVGPIDLAERGARAALEAARGLAPRIGLVSVVGILSPVGPSPAGDLSARLGVEPARVETTTIGGNTPQWLVNRAASEIAAGRLDVALVAGAEAMRSSWARGATGQPPVAAASIRTRRPSAW